MHKTTIALTTNGQASDAEGCTDGIAGCSTGCRGPEPDGTFEFIECPACGSHDTFSTPRGDGVEEVECHACGTITSLQMAPPGPEGIRTA